MTQITKELIKTFKNGTKVWKITEPCPKCDGTGTFEWNIVNGTATRSGICFACHGDRVIHHEEYEFTAERLAKMDAKRQADIAKAEAERKAKEEKLEAERKEREERIAKQKAMSQFVGKAGDKLDMQVRFEYEASYDSFYGRVHVYGMRDEAGNLFVWKTTSGAICIKEDVVTESGYIHTKYDRAEKGDVIRVKATIKEHSEYKGEKQTILNRCKLVAFIERAQEGGEE